MKFLAKYGTAILVVALAAVWRGWNDGWHLIAGLATAGLPWAAIVTWRCLRAAPRGEPDSTDQATGAEEWTALEADTASQADATYDRPARVRESVIVGTLLGAPLGVALSIYLATAFFLIQQIPWLYDRYYDADRPTLEAKLSALEQAGDYGEAAALIENRLARKTGRQWRRILAQRLYRGLVRQADRLPAAQRLPLANRACKLAREHGLDDTAARTLQQQATRDKNLEDRINQLRQRRDWIGVVDVLKSELLRDERSTATAQMLYDALCVAAARCESPDQQAAFYARAVELAGRYRLPAERAQTALALIQSAQSSQSQQTRRLAELHRESAETRRRLLQAMVEGAAEIADPEARLAALRRTAALADQHGVEIASLAQQIEQLDESFAQQRRLAQRVQQLQREQQYEQASELLATAIRTTDRRQWTLALDAELLACLAAWCDAVELGGPPGAEAQRKRLERAVAIASECGVDAPLLKFRLAAAEAHRADRERVRSQIAQLKREERFGDLAAYLNVRIQEQPEAEWAREDGQELCSALVAAALASDDLERRGALLRQAAALAPQYRLAGASEIERHLAETKRRVREAAERERLRTTPVELPPGTKAGVGRIASENWPFVIVDVWVEGADGAPLTGLEAKDFAVNAAGRKVPFAMQPVAFDASPGWFVVVVDLSASAAPALPAIKTGVEGLAAQLLQDQAAQVKLLPFSAEVNAELPWTGDAAYVSRLVHPWKAEGGTALYRALFAAVEELGRQPLPCRRQIVLFTDGKDSEGGLTLDDVLLQCRAKGIAVSAIALRTSELDARILRRITTETGGQYLEAAKAAELGAWFVQAARSLQGRRYRLALDLGRPASEARDPGVFSLTVGRTLTIDGQARPSPRSAISAVTAAGPSAP